MSGVVGEEAYDAGGTAAVKAEVAAQHLHVCITVELESLLERKMKILMLFKNVY